jgi:predicted dehydrogenase
LNEAARLGVIGAGYIAGIHGVAAAGIQDQLRIVAAADPNLAAAEAMVDRYGWERAYGDVGTMLAQTELDGVIIATWPSTHLELIRQCVEAGIRYVLCEKPFVLTGEEAMEVWHLAGTSGAIVTEAFMYRHHPAIERVDGVLAAGSLGPIDHVRASFTYVNRPMGVDPSDPNRPWRFRVDQGGGALYDIGAYAINACTHVASSIPTRVAAFGRVRNDFGTSDKIIGLIDYQNQTVGMIEASEIADSTQELQISGQNGTLYLPFAWTIYDETELTIRRSIPEPHRDGSRSFRTLEDRMAVPKSNAFQDQLRNVAAVIRGAASPRVNLAETVVNTLTMEALARSLREREEVDVVVPREVADAFLEVQTRPSAAA